MTCFTVPSGSLTQGVPANDYAAGRWAFRTAILLAVAHAAVSPSSFSARLLQSIRSEINAGVSIHRVGISIGAGDDSESSWLTIDGSMESNVGFSLTQINRAIARALSETVALSVAMYEAASGQAHLPEAQVLDRLGADGACSGSRHGYGYVIAACTRLDPTGWADGQAAPASQASTPVTAATHSAQHSAAARPVLHTIQHGNMAAPPASPSSQAQPQSQPPIWPYYVGGAAVLAGLVWWISKE